MSQSVANNQEWLKVLGKGMVTIPKQWRQELGIEEGDVVKAKKEGKKVVIEAQQTSSSVPYRVYSDSEIAEFLKEDKLPKSLVKRVKDDLRKRSSS